MADADTPLEITNTRVFDYQEEVVVELHGHVDGEFSVVSYRFSPDQSDDGVRFSGSLEAAHEDVVRNRLAENGYRLR